MPEHVNKKRRGQRRPILAIMNGTDLRQWTYEKGQMHIKSYKDVYNWPARDLNKCSKEVALVDIALAQIGSVLDVAVVAHEAHHAVNVFTLREGKLKAFHQKLHVIMVSIKAHQMTVQRKALRRRFSVLNICRRVAFATTGLSVSIWLSFSSSRAISLA